jgi:phosphonate transport system permease protein
MENITTLLPLKPKQNSLKKTLIWITVFSLIIWGFQALNYNGIKSTAEGTLTGMARAFFNLDTEFLLDQTTDGLPYKMVETITIAIAGTFVSGILAIPFALLSSQNIVGQHVSKIGKFLITMIRSFPELILALVFIRVVGPGAPAGILALGIHSIGMLGKLFSEAIESMDIGVKEAIESCGGNSAEVLFRAVLPQVMPELLSYTLFRFEINMRAASILGLVGAGGIGADLIFSLRTREWEKAFMVVVVLVITVTIIDYISTSIRKKLV